MELRPDACVYDLIRLTHGVYMRTATKFNIATYRQRLVSIGWYALAMVVAGCGIGLLIAWLNEPEMLSAWLQRGQYWDLRGDDTPGFKLMISTMYTITMWSTVLISKHLLFRYVPLRSWLGVAGHVFIITVCTVTMFVVAKRIDAWICDLFLNQSRGAEPPSLQIIVISFIAVIIVTSLTYAFDFYRRLRDAEQTVLQSELKALRAQINPHFLFNTLNSIAALIRIRPEEAERTTEALADLFRYALRASKQPTVTLREELEATQTYIDIEKTRFRDRLHVHIDVANDILDAQVPSLLLQPLVENAVKHGVAQTEDACAVRVCGWRYGKDHLLLEVRDTGPGFSSTDPADVLPNGTGLANVRDRLYLRFGEAGQLRILPDGVQLHFPYQTDVHRPFDPFDAQRLLTRTSSTSAS